jgi:acetylornithine deacetylase
VDSLPALLSELVAIDSVNPELVAGGAGEAEIARFVAGWCERAGLEVELIDAAPGRPSVVATARGSGGGASLMLNAHTDTVGVEGMEAPHEPRIEGNRLYGRGAYDMKASLAAIMLAGARAAELGLRGDVIVTAVCDEEFASIGTQSVLERHGADAAVVTEPTALEVCVAHKGFVWLEVETRGRAAHGSRPDLGVDAIVKMGRVLDGLDRLGRSLQERAHPLLGSGSVHASLIEGGQELSSYPERCLLQVERRTVPGEEDVEGELQELVATLSAADPELRATVRTTLVRAPFEVSPDARIVELVRRHCGLVTGREPQVVGETPWMDAAFVSAAGIPTVVFGPGGEGAHAEVEWVDLDQAQQCSDTLLAVAAELCA